MIAWFKRYCQKFRYVIKNDEGEPYLVRYRLWQSKHGVNVYLHHILRSDYDRALHDHPFDFVTILLWGSYIEWQPHWCKMFFDSPVERQTEPAGNRSFVQVRTHRGWLSVIRHKATDPHRLELRNGKVWSLFLRGPKVREWGFYLNNEKWVPHTEYAAREKGNE
ncbi:hypothetical protein KC906_00265 [Candidatus Kaiserbacteria bacterium]|nr:hypothetical protein [Candidatus Kaiserbacteria bacterium]